MSNDDPASACRCPPNAKCAGATACVLVPAAGDQWQVALIDVGLCGPGSTALGIGLGLGLGLGFLAFLCGVAYYYHVRAVIPAAPNLKDPKDSPQTTSLAERALPLPPQREAALAWAPPQQQRQSGPGHATSEPVPLQLQPPTWGILPPQLPLQPVNQLKQPPQPWSSPPPQEPPQVPLQEQLQQGSQLPRPPPLSQLEAVMAWAPQQLAQQQLAQQQLAQQRQSGPGSIPVPMPPPHPQTTWETQKLQPQQPSVHPQQQQGMYPPPVQQQPPRTEAVVAWAPQQQPQQRQSAPGQAIPQAVPQQHHLLTWGNPPAQPQPQPWAPSGQSAAPAPPTAAAATDFATFESKAFYAAAATPLDAASALATGADGQPAWVAGAVGKVGAGIKAAAAPPVAAHTPFSPLVQTLPSVPPQRDSGGGGGGGGGGGSWGASGRYRIPRQDYSASANETPQNPSPALVNDSDVSLVAVCVPLTKPPLPSLPPLHPTLTRNPRFSGRPLLPPELALEASRATLRLPRVSIQSSRSARRVPARQYRSLCRCGCIRRRWRIRRRSPSRGRIRSWHTTWQLRQ
jgi:hypothetical protein